VYFVATSGLNYSKPNVQNALCGGLYCNTDSLMTQIYSASKRPERYYKKKRFFTHIKRASIFTALTFHGPLQTGWMITLTGLQQVNVASNIPTKRFALAKVCTKTI
jgi:hypothetical protein